MSDFQTNSQASEDFNKARSQEVWYRILTMMNPDKQDLLSFKDVKSMLKPRTELYRGMRVVQISEIAGSEGRYRDFNKTFLPKHEHLRARWESVDKAHIADKILPPIRLYKIGNAYFVRDGNHRVSVAQVQGIEAIDAEVIELTTEITVEPDMTLMDLKEKVIAYERKIFFEQTKINKYIDTSRLFFTATGRFVDILSHIQGHKYFINQGIPQEIPFEKAVVSWYKNIFKPITDTIIEEKLMSRFPGRTSADLYVWIVRHWDDLKKKCGPNFSVRDAVVDYNKKYGTNVFQRIWRYIKRQFFNKE